MASRLVISAFLPVLLLWPLPTSASDLVLARVAGEPVTLEQLKSEFEQRHQGHLQLLGDEDVLRDFLEGAIRRRLFTQEARRMGLDQNERIRQRVADKRAEVGIAWLYQTEVEKPVAISPEQVEAALEKLRHSFQLIVVETDTLDEARAAWRRIDGGEAAEQVARDVSRADSRLRGGQQGVSWGRTAVPALEEALIGSKAGDLLEPVATERGWVVALVELVEILELENPEMSRAVVESVLRRRAVEERRAAYLDRLRAEYEVALATELLDPQRLLPLVGAEGTPDGGAPTIATWRGGTLGLDAFARSIRKESFTSLRPPQQRLQAEQLLSNRLDEVVLKLEVEARWEDAPADLQAKVEALENDLIFRDLLGGVVFGEIELSDADVAAWYAAHAEDYVEPVRILLAVALLETETEAREFLAALDAGRVFADLARERSLDAATAREGGKAGWVVEEEAIAPLRGEPFRQPSGSVGGPIALGEQWLVYRVLDRVAARQVPLDEAREDVRAALMEQKSAERMDRWEEQLREATIVRVNDAAVRKAGKQLTAEKQERFREETPAPAMGHRRGHP